MDIREIPQTMDSLLGVKEFAVSQLAESATTNAASRCGFMSGCSEECSHWACSNEHEGTCRTDFGTPSMCTKKSGQVLSFDESYVRVPFDADWEAVGVKESICEQRSLDDTFKALFETYGLRWTYYGSSTGVMRSFPGKALEHFEQNKLDRMKITCSRYDPRQRPWYVSASGGPKDVMIVADVSSAMIEPATFEAIEERWTILRASIKGILGTLTFTDRVGLAFVGNGVTRCAQATVRSLHGGQSEEAAYQMASCPIELQAASALTVEGLELALDSVVPEGEASIPDAFTAGFNVLEASQDSASTGCERFIIYLTAGNDSALYDDMHALDDFAETTLATQQARLTTPAHLFSFGMGILTREAAVNILRETGCRHNGAYQRVADSRDVVAEMSTYYQYLAAGTKSGGARWSTPYRDFAGLGMMTTVAQAVFDSAGVLRGVAATDVLLKDLYQYADITEIEESLMLRSMQCSVANMTACTMQLIRSGAGSLSLCDNPAWGPPDVDTCALSPEVMPQPGVCVIGVDDVDDEKTETDSRITRFRVPHAAYR
jgi:hypothetical protein